VRRIADREEEDLLGGEHAADRGEQLLLGPAELEGPRILFVVIALSSDCQ